MSYIYFFTNASLILRVIEFLNSTNRSVQSMTVIHRWDGWLLKVKFKYLLTLQEDGDVHSFMTELGSIYKPNRVLEQIFFSLETGISPITVMRRYSVAVVAHGLPDRKDIVEFCQCFTKGLGYYPESLA